MTNDFSKNFACKVFNDSVMCERLPTDTYRSLKRSIDEGRPLDPAVADVVAAAMMDWAVDLGATHYTHWFQPMTNITAGKHDSFVSPQRDGHVILEFSGKELIKGEPDASSFPNGGLRNTFEARGYTAWDCTSPAFVRDGTLYIPTAFCSYTGEALDTKTPLLRSMEAVSKSALRILRAFGNHTSKRVISTVGAEQEYFLVDRDMYEKRLDLKICGRTLLGARPPKGQEMDDYYCGRIRLRVAAFMKELDEALWELGVTSKTKHNEVAPAQHELAPVFCSANIASDHNQLTMEMMRIIAKKNHLACLLHEKPFSGVNGSGKHNNWSLSTDDGLNLLEPGKTPYENVQFLLFLCAIITGVDRYADLIRLSAAVAGNDQRLGANEAPPAIISIFLGDQLASILENIAQGNENHECSTGILETGVVTLPQLPLDDSDRNRTSPFAFTGNKFEFRMVGSSQNIAQANYVLNTIVAESLDAFADRLAASSDFDGEIRRIISDTVREHRRIIYNGNNYTADWVQEAEKRGLPNLTNTVDAIKTFIDEKNVTLFKRYNVLTPAECHSRYEVMLENYTKIVHIEANTLLLMLRRQVIPASIEYLTKLANAHAAAKTAGFGFATAQSLGAELSYRIDQAKEMTDELAWMLDEIDPSDPLTAAERHRDEVLPQMAKIRAVVDSIEEMTADTDWPMPTYTDLLHRV